MAAPRGEFTSRFGFLMAASGSAVGLGNIWGFPTNTASNGGAAFLFTYLLLAFALAYPALMAELIIGRHARANAVTALKSISPGRFSQLAAVGVGFVGILTVSFILSFYAIVSGWMIAFFLRSFSAPDRDGLSCKLADHGCRIAQQHLRCALYGAHSLDHLCGREGWY